MKTLTCGGLNIGGGGSIVPEGPTPDGSTYRYLLTCNGSSCTIGPTSTMPPVNSSDPDCSNTGCKFGAPLPIPNPAIPGITTCVMNTWKAPASGTLDLSTGSSSQDVPLNSDIYLTGNLAQPCPKCSGTCDRGPRAGLACTTTSSLGVSRDCPTGGTAPTGCGPMGTDPCPCTCTPGGGQCIDGSHVGVITVNLSPLTTGTATASSATGQFCNGQQSGTHAGCFGQNSCRTITENGTPYGAIMLGVPAPATLASVFCIDATMNGLVDASADLPGPGAIALPGVFLVVAAGVSPDRKPPDPRDPGASFLRRGEESPIPTQPSPKCSATGTATSTNPTGQFCPGQLGGSHAGCFGSNACRTITETGSASGPLSPGVPASGRLASTFCVAATGNGLVDASADLPGPGAVSLPGTFIAD